MPSQADWLIWHRTEEDIRCQTKIRLGFEVAVLSQHFEQLGKIVSTAFGGGEDSKPERQPTKSLADAKKSLGRIFKK